MKIKNKKSVNKSDVIASTTVNNEVERMRKEAIALQFKGRLCFFVWKQIMKNLCQDIGCSGRDFDFSISRIRIREGLRLELA
jgi:hypothetical protein